MRIALALSALLLLRPAWADTPPAPLEYLVRIVGGADAPDLPLVIAVHGLGDRPESFIGLLDGAPFRARVLAPRAPVPYGRGGTWFALADPPDDRMRAELAESADRLAALAAPRPRSLASSPGSDHRVLPRGGMLSFAVAARHPRRGSRAHRRRAPRRPSPCRRGRLIRALHAARPTAIPSAAVRQILSRPSPARGRAPPGLPWRRPRGAAPRPRRPLRHPGRPPPGACVEMRPDQKHRCHGSVAGVLSEPMNPPRCSQAISSRVATSSPVLARGWAYARSRGPRPGLPAAVAPGCAAAVQRGRSRASEREEVAPPAAFTHPPLS
ncbi:MAG: hypothetical protein R3F43_25760 [bacterium]